MDPAFEGLPVLILPADRPPPDLRYSTSVSALDSAENAVTLADGHRAWALLQREWLEEQWEKMTSVAAMSLYDSRRLYAGAWACAIRAAAAAPGATLPACDVTAPLQDDATRAAFASFNNLTDLASEGPWRRLESGRKKVDYYNGSCRAECYHPRRWGNARNTNATFHY